jgi:hypothetical protein
VQPTDILLGRFSCFLGRHGNPLEGTRWVPSSRRRVSDGKLGARYRVMKARLLRLLAVASTIGAAVLAGGASLKGF